MILTLAWRNIWRNPTRSLVVIIAIALGIWAAMFMSGFATGMVQSYVDNAIANRVSHLQIHHPEYEEDQDIQFSISKIDQLKNKLDEADNISGVSYRTLANGMLASSKTSRAVRIRGIEPAAEQAVTGLQGQVESGTYFEGDRKNQILLSERLADKLGVKLKKKVVLTFQDKDREIVAAAFRVVGIYDTGNNIFDDVHIFVKHQDIQRLLGVDAQNALYHEAAILLQDKTGMDSLQHQLQTQFPNLLIENYRERAPDVDLYESMLGSLSLIYLIIIMLALVFGIINTMLMAVLERIRELGMLMAIGMNKLKVFLMIMTETLLLTLVGAPLGLGLGALTVAYVGKKGLDLSAFSSAMEMYGMSNVVYFELSPAVYGQVVIVVSMTAILASIYPALKAIRLKPVEAIRKL